MLKCFFYAILALTLLSACGPSAEQISATQSAQTEAVNSAVEATVSALEQARLRQGPSLLSPASESTFSNIAEVKLEWDWYRPLAENEVFDVRVWRDGEPANGITWTQEKTLDMLNWLLYQPPGDYFWTVAVMSKKEDGSAEQITDEVPPQGFTMERVSLDLFSVPEGFQSTLYAKLPITLPTVITFGPDDALYALSTDGNIARVSDEDGDHFAETSTVIFSDDADVFYHAVGLAYRDDLWYVSHSGKISTLQDEDGDGTLDADSLNTIVEGLPSMGHIFHSNNGIAFGPDDRLYVSVGASSDHSPKTHPFEAAVLSINPDGSDIQVFAEGFRNAYDVTFSPEGELFTADNSPDNLDEDLAYLPPEELNYVREGRNYGFPYVFGNRDGGGLYEMPVTEFFTSSGSAGLTYYGADQFPEDYRGVYVAMFGTGSPDAVARGLEYGHDILFVPLEPTDDGGYKGEWMEFAQFRTDLGEYSPIDLTVGPDGALYVAEWTTATIHRVVYVGESGGEATPEVALVEPTPAPVNFSAEEITSGEELYRRGTGDAPACITCHLLDSSKAAVGPSLLNIDEAAGTRVEGLSAEAYIRQSIVDPNAHVVEGYNAGYMYPDYAQHLSDEQIDALVAYVLTLRD
jgi:glucose/arabinose dehydrogenase/cytochrome c553